ncbi:hypothetical protein [Streptomyces tailanensis]|uniref:hypothetical protein n=1 Tax=Streptomyces tailanensis TaxID=2569858 RepID=UPI001FE64CF4|nr:hypothetical protein [Streptomyces tailanensis]
MPRGRHRHSPPLHRLLPPTAIAGVSLVCALGPWIFSEPPVLRVSAAVAAATAAVGAAVMRRWDVEAGKRVADLTRARASDEWRHEEKIAELETDLDESRELRTKLEHKLRAKRTELANLRNEHAALLRRYATAETERASALEGRRLLEIEATAPEDARALPAGPAPTAASQASPVPPQGVPVQGTPWAAREGASKGETVAASDDVDVDAEVEVEKSIPAVFSPAGSALFLQANSALERMIKQRESVKDSEDSEGPQEEDGAEDTGSEAEAEAGAEVEAEADVEVESEAVAGDEEDAAEAEAEAESADQLDEEADDESAEAPVKELSSKEGSGKDGSPKGDPDGPTGGGTRQGRSAEAEAEPVPVVTAEADEPAGMSEEVDGREHAAAEPVSATPAPEAPVPARSAESALPALPDVRPAGHFTVPTAVAVVPAAPQRRAAVEGGFDFFGTQKEADAFEAVQNEDLADVVGQEALALHKAESEAQFKRVDEASRGIGQVIDLTAHDETEQIDVQGLRTAAS